MEQIHPEKVPIRLRCGRHDDWGAPPTEKFQAWLKSLKPE
jgi:hypothetical protein